MLVSFAVGYAQQIAPIIGARIAADKRGGGRFVHEPQVAGVAAISTTKGFRRMLQKPDRGSRLAGGDGRREARISATNDENVARFHHVRCRRGRSSRMSFTVSSARTLAMRFVLVAAPRTDAIRSRALATTSSRLMGFSAVPRTASTRSLR